MATNGNLTPKKKRALAALLANATIKDSASAAGVGYTTLIRWLDDSTFKAALRDAQNQQVAQATARLAGELPAAIATLSEIHRDDTQPPSARVRAASMVLDYYMRFIDAYDLAERVERLEAQLL